MKIILFFLCLLSVSAGGVGRNFSSWKPDNNRQTAFFRTHYQRRGEVPELYAKRGAPEKRQRDFSLYRDEVPDFYRKAEFSPRRPSRVIRTTDGGRVHYNYPALEEPVYGYRLVPDYVYEYYDRALPEDTVRIRHPRPAYVRRHSWPDLRERTVIYSD